ncbi:MAG: hypothetical protein JWN70_2555 [Planctomycetaceae bacterium]|nr:hypothetical protein [Planctomycetaceae bacterium]
MPIRIECSDCGTALKVKDQAAGRKIRCPHCDAINQVPAENEGTDDGDDDEVVSRTRSSSTSSRSKQSRRSQAGRSRTNDDDELEEMPQPSKRKKKKTSQKSKSGSGGKVPFWAIVAGSSLAGVLVIAVIMFVVMKPRAPSANAQVAGAAAPAPPQVVQAQVEGPHAKIRMKFEMPLNWTSEGSIEDNRWPWATMKGQGQVIKLSSNRSLLGAAESRTTMGGATEQLKASHTMRGTKLQAESTDWVDGQLGIHEGKMGPVIWSNYEYKGVFGKGYGIRCTINGPAMPCNLMLECGESSRDKWRPTLLAIAESVHFVSIKDGKEERDDFEFGAGDEMPNAEQADQPEPDDAPEDKP